MKKILLLAGVEVRHKYFAALLKANYGKFDFFYAGVEKPKSHFSNGVEDWQINHRTLYQVCESEQMGEAFIQPDVLIPRDEINSESVIQKLNLTNNTHLIVFGSPILSGFWFSNIFTSRVNIHLGLSPFYTGSGTMLWPFIFDEPDKCGITVHELTEKLDMGDYYKRFNLHNREGDYYSLVNGFLKETLLHISRDEGLICGNMNPKKYSELELRSQRADFRRKDFTEKEFNIIKSKFFSV